MMKFRKYLNIEFASTADSKTVQEELLRKHVAYCMEHSPYYQRIFTGLNVRPEQLTLENLVELPLTGKAELGAHNDEFLSVPASRVVDIVLSSGTTGSPTRIMYTEQDLVRLAYNEEKSFASCGITADDVVLLTCTMDRCFIAGLAYFLGIRNIGAAAIRNGHGTMESHMEIIKRMRPTTVVCVPSFMRKLALYMADNREDPTGSSVSKIVCIGEPVRDENMQLLKLGSDLETMWQAKVYSTYASSETVTTFCECTAQCGGHLHPDLAIVEILNDQGMPVPAGEAGEVVVTPLSVEGMPLIRFQTGDIAALLTDQCKCGRTSPRLGPVIGRKQQMMKVRGTSLYPQDVYSALDEVGGIVEYYLEVTGDDRLSDKLIVHVLPSADGPDSGTIAEKLQARLRVKPVVVVDNENEIRRIVYPAKSRKPIRFIDAR
ncbi:MAG: AMP-binding protein [Lentisphaerae bacterium]|nr:AMP-binding protein [Lentisphaerota bacterium]